MRTQDKNKLPKARENACDRVAIGFSCVWLVEGGSVNFQDQSQREVMQT